MPHLTIEEGHNDSRCLLTAVGEIDLASAPDLEVHLRKCVEEGPVVVDLSNVSFIDSTGLRVLLTAHEAASAHGHRLGLVAVDGPVTKLFGITGVADHLHVFGTVEAALSDA